MGSMINIIKQSKVQLLLLLLLLTVIGLEGNEAWSGRLGQAGFAVLSAVFAEWAFFGIVRSTHLQSAGISGLLAGMLLAPGTDLSIVWFTAVASIASKKLLRSDEQNHVFNPATFGLVLATVFFGNQMTWWGNSSSILLIIGAGFILFQLNRLSLPFSYFIARTLTAVLCGEGLMLPVTFMLPNLFFAFIMLVEPKTSPSKRSEQWMFGALTGIISSIVFRFMPAVDGDMTGLLAANFFYSCLRTIKHSRLL